MLPPGVKKRPNEYDHAQGCPKDSDRILSLWQPWASACFLSYRCIDIVKTIETRGFGTDYRGRLWIHAAKKKNKEVARAIGHMATSFPGIYDGLPDKQLPFGAVIGSVMLVDIVPTEMIRNSLSDVERAWGNYAVGRKAWILEKPELLPKPIPFSGSQGPRKCAPFLERAA